MVAQVQPARRDYAGEMTAAIDSFIPAGEYVTRVVAENFIDYMRVKDPELLDGWLAQSLVVLVSERISSRRRHLARRAQGQTVEEFLLLSQAADEQILRERAGFAAKPGVHQALRVFTQTLVVNSQHVVRPIGRMTKEDHLFVAARYAATEKSARFERAFHEAIAAKIGPGQVTSDVFTEVEYLRLRESL